MLRRTLAVRSLIPCIAVLSIALPAAAEASTTSLEVPLELQFQGVAVERGVAFEPGLVLEPGVAVDLGHGLQLQTVAVYESAAPEDFGAEELLLRRDGEFLSVWSGKFNPAFGQAWDQDVAVFDGHAGAYELTEKFGFGAAVQWGDDTDAQLKLTGNVFGDPTRPSYTMSVEAQPIVGLTLITAVMDADNQQGLLLGARSEFSIGERTLAPLVEIATIADELLLSMGLSLDEGAMRYTLQNSARRTSFGDESIVQATASWAL